MRAVVVLRVEAAAVAADLEVDAPTRVSSGHESIWMRQPWSSVRCRCSTLSLQQRDRVDVALARPRRRRSGARRRAWRRGRRTAGRRRRMPRARSSRRRAPPRHPLARSRRAAAGAATGVAAEEPRRRVAATRTPSVARLERVALGGSAGRLAVGDHERDVGCRGLAARRRAARSPWRRAAAARTSRPRPPRPRRRRRAGTTR